MRYLNIQTLKQTTEFIDDITTIIDTDARVVNWFNDCPDGFRGEWVNGVYTFVEIPLPTQTEIATHEQEMLNQEAREYLSSTDWMIIRELEGGTLCPNEIKILRAEARAKVI